MPTKLRRKLMDTLDVRGIDPEGVDHLKRLATFYRQQNHIKGNAEHIKKRRVDPAEFEPGLSKLKAPLTRALAYDG